MSKKANKCPRKQGAETAEKILMGVTIFAAAWLWIVLIILVVTE
jgi:hypothetical protein